ncbi:MAG: hypothetical protein QOJ40_2945 [Verrucomicrobiota bacterium]
MKKLPKFFLTVCLTALATGAVVCFSNINAHPSWAVAFPIGAIFYGLFLSAYMLQDEVERFDEEEAKKRRLAMMGRAAPTTRQGGKPLSDKVARRFVNAHAHSH